MVVGRVKKTPNIPLALLEFLILFPELDDLLRHLIMIAGVSLVLGEDAMTTSGVAPWPIRFSQPACHDRLLGRTGNNYLFCFVYV